MRDSLNRIFNQVKLLAENYWLPLLIGVVLLGLCMRLIGLGSIPPAVSHDEADYILNGYNVALKGSDISGTWEPTSLLPISTHTRTAELPPLLFALAYIFLPLTLTSTDLIPVLLSTATIPLLFLFTRSLKRSKLESLTAAILLAIQPWSIFFSHTAFEAPIGVIPILGILIAIVALSNRKNIALDLLLIAVAGICSFIAFFFYHGFKFLLLPVLLIAGVYLFSRRRDAIAIGAVSFLLILQGALLGRTILLQESYSSRSSELIFTNASIAEQVNTKRRLSLDNNFNTMYWNKGTELLLQSAKSYFEAFSVSTLFITGSDPAIQYSLQEYGYLHSFSALFIVMGIVRILTRRSREDLFLLAVILVSPLPAVIHTDPTYAIRTSLLFVLLPIVAATGISFSLEINRNKETLRNALFVAIGLGYLFSTIMFMYFFRFRAPILTAERYFFQERLLANYITRIDSSSETRIVLQGREEPYHLLRSAALYIPAVRETVLDELQGYRYGIDSQTFSLQGIAVSRDCKALVDVEGISTLIINPNVPEGCERTLDQLKTAMKTSESEEIVVTRIGNPTDSGTLYYSLQKKRASQPCNQESISHFVHITRLSQLQPEILNDAEFCSTYVLKE